MNRLDNNISLASGSLILAATMVIAGCNNRNGDVPDLPEICPAPCQVPIELPGNVGERPKAPPTTVVEGGTVVNFNLDQVSETNAERTVLSFEKPVFVDDIDGQQRLLYTLELTAGDNEYKVRPFKKGECDLAPGCRYVVINIGRPGRPSVISSPYFVIR